MAESQRNNGWRARYEPGWLTLVGVLCGAGFGWLVGPANAIPFGLAAGLAAGVGLDSLLNRHINGPFDDPNHRN